MILACARRFALGVLAFALLACSSAGGGVATSDDGAAPPPAASVTFDDGDVLTTTPKASVDVVLHVSGDDANVSLWLEGDYADASLSAGEVTTTAQRAKLTLHAPSVPATFTLRARLAGAPDARLGVSVSAAGFSNVRVLATYSGKRAASSITASVFVKSTCADIAAASARGQLVDGALAHDGVPGSPLTITSVPAGSHLSVLVRVRFYATGCVDLEALAPTATHDVTVDVIDRAMALDVTDLETSFTFTPDPADLTAWSRMIDTATAQAANAFVAQGSNEAKVLLDAMRALVPSSSQAAFDTSRTQGSFDSRTATWLTQHTPTLRDRATAWMTAGKPDTMGELVAHLAPGASAGYGTLSLESMGAIDATSAGLAVISPFTWTADPEDVVHLAGTVHVWPTALTCAAADRRAVISVAFATDAPSALALQIDCDGLATSLVGAGVSYPSCAASCTASLCQQGLARMWSAARNVSSLASEDLPIEIAASAPAHVGDHAEPTGFDGAWVGQIGSASSVYGVFGTKGVARGLRGSVPR